MTITLSHRHSNCAGPLSLTPDTEGFPLSMLVKLLKQVFFQAKRHQAREIIIDGKGIYNLFKMNEEDTLKFLSAFYKDHKSLGINGPRSHIVLAPTTPSTAKLSLHLPVFLQERGSEAYKLAKY